MELLIFQKKKIQRYSKWGIILDTSEDYLG